MKRTQSVQVSVETALRRFASDQDYEAAETEIVGLIQLAYNNGHSHGTVGQPRLAFDKGMHLTGDA